MSGELSPDTLGASLRHDPLVVSTAGSPLLVGFALDAGRGLDELLLWGMGSVAVVALLALGVRRPESAPR